MKIFGIGRNYAEHARELKNEVPGEPVVFLKPDTALLLNGAPFYYPSFSQDVHYECELVVRIHREGRNIAAQFAPRYYDQLTMGIDFTARDLQAEAKAKGLPWAIAKAFDQSAPLGRMVPVAQYADVQALGFELKVNGEVRQQGNTRDMLFPVDELVAYVSRYFTLKTGDLIFTGTPAGVGPVQVGDVLEASLEGESLLRFEVK